MNCDVFQILKIYNNTQFIAYMIYTVHNEVCFIFDFMTVDVKLIRTILTHVVCYFQKSKKVSFLRITLNANHPYRRALTQCGFLRRKQEGVVQLYAPSRNMSLLASPQWFITLGDKDA
jgi:hypothetical protein